MHRKGKNILYGNLALTEWLSNHQVNALFIGVVHKWRHSNLKNFRNPFPCRPSYALKIPLIAVFEPFPPLEWRHLWMTSWEELDIVKLTLFEIIRTLKCNQNVHNCSSINNQHYYQTKLIIWGGFQGINTRVTREGTG